ncbi:CHASE3 domain-containing protein [Vibrio sonorensis]|uniref:CHASE3 domain-containing protein n=1 Tax=Vibrio sonorensis TaxID=1004316 RepID=UPI001FE1831F|nr:MCP four helix bundle domain-containing protein [Vibrio sonorensis]
MALSIVQRTILGYLIMFLLLALLGGISYWKLVGVNSDVNEVTEEATPLLVNSSKLYVTILTSQRNLLEYLTYQSESQLPPVEKAYEEQKAAFRDEIEQIKSQTNNSDISEQIEQLANDYFAKGDQIMALHSESLMINQSLIAARGEFVKYEDAFQKVTTLLIDKLGKSRSQRNKVDRLTSGVKRDLKELRTARQDMDLPKLIDDFEKNLQKAKAGIRDVKISKG